MLLSKTPLLKTPTAPAVPLPGYSCFIGFDVAKQDITVYRMPADGGEPSLPRFWFGNRVRPDMKPG